MIFQSIFFFNVRASLILPSICSLPFVTLNVKGCNPSNDLPMNMATAMIDNARVEAFNTGLRGQLIQVEDEDYDQARKIRNAMIDMWRRLIARCADDANVISSVLQEFGSTVLAACGDEVSSSLR